MNNEAKEQKSEFVDDVNKILVEKNIDFVVSNNPYDMANLVQLYECVMMPITFGGPSTLVENVMDNFSSAKFGVDDELGNGSKEVEETRLSLSNAFFEMKLVVMMIVNASEYIDGIKRRQYELKLKK